MHRLARRLGVTPQPMTRARVFPGGAIPDFPRFLAQVRARWPYLGEARSARMAHAYGACLNEMLRDTADLGEDLGAGLTETEIRWMRDHEWARTVEDVLWRRSKIGLHVGPDSAQRVAAILDKPLN
jgi:glycerol-3-phosphate dehydrogenase